MVVKPLNTNRLDKTESAIIFVSSMCTLLPKALHLELICSIKNSQLIKAVLTTTTSTDARCSVVRTWICSAELLKGGGVEGGREESTVTRTEK